MILLPLLNSAFQFAARVPAFIKEQKENSVAREDESDRLKVASDVIEFLDQHSLEIDVEFLRGSYEGTKDTELQVSILYYALHKMSGKFIGQHKSYCLDFSSWGALERDIHTLARIYSEIHEREVLYDNVESDEFWPRIDSYRRYAKNKADKSQSSQIGRQP